MKKCPEIRATDQRIVGIPLLQHYSHLLKKPLDCKYATFSCNVECALTCGSAAQRGLAWPGLDVRYRRLPCALPRHFITSFRPCSSYTALPMLTAIAAKFLTATVQPRSQFEPLPLLFIHPAAAICCGGLCCLHLQLHPQLQQL